VETGKVVWSHDEGSFVTSSPSYAAGMLVVGGGDDPGIEGLTAQTGARVWFVPTRLFVRGAPIIANDAAIATADDGSILAMRLRNGSLLWTLDAGERIHGSPAVVEGKVIVGRMDGILRAYGDEALAAASTGSSTAAVAGSGDGTGGLLGMLPIAVALGVPYLALRWARDRMRTRLAAKNAAPTDARAAGVAAMLGLSGAVAGSSAPPVVKVHCPRCSCRFGIEAKEQNIIECPACGLRSEVRRRRSARPGPSG